MNHPEWGEGPWNREEDHAVWVDEPTGLDCMINRGPSGALCGYVGVGPDHPLHGVHYGDVEVDIEVHGGLTYSQACQEGGEICHVPAEGREHDIWWFGFDCAHGFDYMPKFNHETKDIIQSSSIWGFPDQYKGWAYVCGEITGLAAQLAQLTE